MKKILSISNRMRRLKNRAVYPLYYRPYREELPHLNGERSSFENLLTFALDHVIGHYYDPQKNYFRKRVALQRGAAGFRADQYELFSRTLIGLGYELVHQENPRLQGIYLSIIRQGINKDSPLSWGKISHRQVLVENTSVIIAFLLNPHKLWDQLSNEDQTRLIEHIRSCSQQTFLHNNWLWFKVFHLLFLEVFAGETHEAGIAEALRGLEALYTGEGWYSDGIEAHELCFDHYNAWAFHYYGLLFCKLAPARYDSIKKVHAQRFQLFARHYRLCFNGSSLPIPWGRSLIYRFAIFSCFGLAIDLGLIEESGWPEIKNAVINTVNKFLKEGIFDENGILTMGFTVPSSTVLEPYCADGSPYWALKLFSFLLLPPQHPFWQANADRINSPTQELSLIRGVNIYLSSSANGHNFLLNGGLNSKRYSFRYNRIAYSNLFPQTYEHVHLDNAIVFDQGFGAFTRDEILERKSVNDCLQFRWRVSRIPGLEGRTTLFPLNDGYISVSLIKSAVRLRYRVCGFSVPVREEGKIEQGPDMIQFSCGSYKSRLTLMDMNAKTGIRYVHGSKVIDGQRACVPYAASLLKPGLTRLAYCSQASHQGTIATDPFVIGADSVQVSQEDHLIRLQKVGEYYE